MAAAAESTPQFVATIDFGTTYCSVAYLLRPDLAPNLNEVDPTVLTLDNAGNRRVPSCILFDPDGKKMAFGYEARDQYADLEPELRPLHHYFEHVKKVLQHKKVNNSPVSVKLKLGAPEERWGWDGDLSPWAWKTIKNCIPRTICEI